MMFYTSNKDLETLTAICHLALGLEVWFPADNSAFAYGTRLCEETGELVEALHTFDGSVEAEQHLVKEVKDVLQIVMGVLGIYQQNDQIPSDITAFFAASAKLHLSDADIIELSIRAGRFADAINHAESQGVKQQKHAETPDVRLIEAATAFITCIARFIQQYDLVELLETEIQKDYLCFITKDLIKN